MNIGAEKETDYGLYFAWGETQGYSGITDEKKFSWNDYKFGTESNLTKYNAADGLTKLEPSDNAAVVNWGLYWQMPVLTQVVELYNTSNCTFEWVTDYNGSGIDGGLFTSVRNGNKIFIPAAGVYSDGNLVIGEQGSVWTRNLYSGTFTAGALLMQNDYIGFTHMQRKFGSPIRPVCF